MKIKELATRLGADIFGVADLELLSDYPVHPPELLEKYTRGIVVGVKLPDAVFDSLPSSLPIYASCYSTANRFLDQITFTISREIERSGYAALPVPASKIVRGLKWRSFISHKAIARAAGVGWIGKSLLLVTPQFGPRIRLATILTDMPLETGEPVKNRCGKCRSCIESCIVGALKDSEFEEYPVREDVFDVERCAAKLKENAADPNIGEMVCGICIKVCPVGRSNESSSR